MSDGPIYVFDGACVLCNGFVRFLLAHETAPELRFAAMQSSAGKALMERAGLPADDPDSVILIEGDRIDYGARAVLRALRLMRLPWRWIAVLAKLPAGLLEPPYRLLARNRHRFGRPSSCAVAEPGRVLG